MFDKSKVECIICNLKNNIGYFVSEAHLQMSFILAANNKYGKGYVFIPEYPIQNGKKRDELDLLIIDTNTEEKTVIEFKHKTKNGTGKNERSFTSFIGTKYQTTITPKSHLAQDLGCYDCWKDIERIEELKNQQIVKNGFFVFITNDKKYPNGLDVEESGYAFSMKGCLHKSSKKDWNNSKWIDNDGTLNETKKLNSIGSIRNDTIEIKKDYEFEYNEFQSGNKENETYWSLIVEI